MWTARPTLVNNLAVSVNRTLSESFAGFRDKNGQPYSLATLGSNLIYPPGYAPDIDQLSTNGFWFGQNTNAPMKRRNIALTDSLTWTKSRHMFVFGVDILRMNYQDSTNWQSSPRISFDGEVTGIASAGIAGSDRADFLRTMRATAFALLRAPAVLGRGVFRGNIFFVLSHFFSYSVSGRCCAIVCSRRIPSANSVSPPSDGFSLLPHCNTCSSRFSPPVPGVETSERMFPYCGCSVSPLALTVRRSAPSISR